MKLGSVLLVLSLVAAVGFVGCGDQGKKPAPAPTIGVAPGETAPYEDTAAPKGPPATQTIVATPLPYGSQPVQKTDVTPPPTSAKKPAAAKTKDTTTGTPTATVKTYKVLKGDTFSSISKKVYGSSKYAKKIYEANKDKPGVKSLDVVDEGVELKIP